MTCEAGLGFQFSCANITSQLSHSIRFQMSQTPPLGEDPTPLQLNRNFGVRQGISVLVSLCLQRADSRPEFCRTAACWD